MTNQPHFDVFLAHNSQDKPQVRIIATKLEQHGLKVWLDENQIPPGRPFQDVIQQAIQNVRSAAIFIGPGGLGNWQIPELRTLNNRSVNAGIPVIPVLLPGVDRIPENLLFLQEISWVSFASGIDDENALNRLMWGITQPPIVSSPTPSHFDVLLFYNDEDKQEVQPIIEHLREQKIQLWVPQKVIGDPWQQVLETQIAQINSVAVLIGRNGILWKKEQIELFIWEFIERRCPVIPVILRNVPQEPELPTYLRRRTRVDFRQQKPNPMEQLILGIIRKGDQDNSSQVGKDSPEQLHNFPLPPITAVIGAVMGSFITWLLIAPPTTNLQMSSGEQILVAAYDPYLDKKDGVQAFASSDFKTAISKFNEFRNVNKDDPEALIYLNNAKAKAGNSPLFKIAVSVPVVANIDIATEMLRGVAQAQDEINNSSDNINGALLQVEIANDNNDPDLAQQIAKEFIKDNSILAVVGHNASEVTLRAAQEYQGGKLVMITPTSFGPDTLANTNILEPNYIFRTVPKSDSLAGQFADYIFKVAHKTNIVICYDSKAQDNNWFKENFESAYLKYKASGAKVSSIVCDFAAPNFNPKEVISQASNEHADSLLLNTYVKRIEPAVDLIQENKRRLALFGNPTMYISTRFQPEQANNADGLVLISPWHSDAIPGNIFASHAKKLWGGQVTWRTATAYDATMAIIEGLKRIKSDPTRDNLQKEISSPTVLFEKGALGPIHFEPSGDRKGNGFLVRFGRSSQSNTGYDFMITH